ncbi:hypothetical protein ACKKBG_A31995 [Auxenochlorella protothecoides x Auxenochlorella symbiontica]
MCMADTSLRRRASAAHADTYPRLKTLHRGGNSVVYRAQSPAGGTLVAKRYHIHAMCSRELGAMRREMRLLRLSQDVPGVVRLLDQHETALTACMIMEDCDGGDLYNMMRFGDALSADWVASTVVKPLLRILASLHATSIIHRDIKPENLLLDARGSLKLADFGLSIDQRKEIPFLRAGTLDYMAPEVVRGRSTASSQLWEGPETSLAELEAAGIAPYDEKVDVWAVGVLAYELVVGQAPFFSPSEQRTMENIRAARAPHIPLRLAGTPWADFVATALAPNSTERPSAARLLDHAWLAGEGPEEARDEGIDRPPETLQPPKSREAEAEGKLHAEQPSSPRTPVRRDASARSRPVLHLTASCQQHSRAAAVSAPPPCHRPTRMERPDCGVLSNTIAPLKGKLTHPSSARTPAHPQHQATAMPRRA